MPPELRLYYGTESSVSVQELLGPAALVVILIFIVTALGGWLWQHAQTVSQQKKQASTARPHYATVISPVTRPKVAMVQAQSSQPATISSPPTSTTTDTIPNTGPNTIALWLAAGAGVIGTAAGYVRSLRSLKVSGTN